MSQQGIDDATLAEIQSALQLASDAGRYAVAVYRIDSDGNVNQFLTCREFPHSKVGDAVRLLTNQLLGSPVVMNEPPKPSPPKPPLASDTEPAIPILISVRDRLTWPKAMAEKCRTLQGNPRVIVCDNDSSYPPLLEWLDHLERTPSERIEVVRFGENAGPRGPWRVPLGDAKHYVVTDCDLDIDDVLDDVLIVLRETLNQYPQYVKVGLGLSVYDVYDRSVLEAEAHHWSDDRRRTILGRTCYETPLDTTFAMYRVNPPYNGDYSPALRFVGNYSARHLPWYINKENITFEDHYYFKHARGVGLAYTPRQQELFRLNEESA